MLKISQDVYLCYDLLLLLVVHFSIFEFFPDEDAPICLPTHFAHAAKTTYHRTKRKKKNEARFDAANAPM